MQKVTFQDIDRHYIWNELVDKRCAHNLLHKFNPNYTVEWWEASIRLKKDVQLENVQVRQMYFDLQVSLPVLKEILDMDTHYLFIYQFRKPIPGSLILDDLPAGSKETILRKNELQHCIEIEHDLVTVSSFDDDYIDRLKTTKTIASKILNR